MKRLVTREQMKLLEQRVAQQGLPGEILMESAAAWSAAEILRRKPQLTKVLVFCGPGHNGGDGYAVARQLHSEGVPVQVIAVGEPNELCARQKQLCERHHIQINTWAQFVQVGAATEPVSVVVDALFGIGLDRPLTSPYLDVIRWIRQSSAFIVSLDVPSGLDCNRGVIWGDCVCASLTLTFGLAKPGFYLHDGPAHVGEVCVHAIGFPPREMAAVATDLAVFDGEAARQCLPRRSPTANKSNLGHALLCAGHPGTWGAAHLCAQACYRSGVGYTTLASHEDLRELVREIPEILTARLDDSALWAKSFQAVGVGPGLGVGGSTAQVIAELRKLKMERVVLDADALTVCAREDLRPLPASWTLTPHAGEMSRLLGISAQEIEGDRLTAVRYAVQRWGCHVVLKGFHTVVGAPSGEMRVIASGNAALAKAGTGDVLTGLMTGFLAQSSMSVVDAISLAAYVHGWAADRWVMRGLSQRSFQPSDLLGDIPRVLRELET